MNAAHVNPVGVFVLHCIDQRWPKASCEREVLNLFAHGDEEKLRQYVATMYEIFDYALTT